MYMMTIVVMLSGMLYLLFRSPERHRGTAPVRRAFNPYPAAAIGPQEGGCAEVLALQHQRFLAWDAPDIPIPQCSSKTCQCRYVCFSDRRAGAGDRRCYFTETAMLVDSDQRAATDRRREILEEVDMEFSDFSWGDEPVVSASELNNCGVWRDPGDKRPPPKSSTHQK